MKGHIDIDKIYANILDLPYFSSLSYEQKFDITQWLEHTAHIKLNFNYRLTSKKSPQHYSYLPTADLLPQLLDEDLTIDKIYEDLNIPDISLDNNLRRGLVYREGEIYWMPYLGKFIASLENNFRIEVSDNMADSIKHFELQMKSNQLAYLSKTQDCTSCDLLSVCLNRGIIESMNIYDHAQCVIPQSRKSTWKEFKAVR